MICLCARPASRIAGGTRVVLPAPGSAMSMTVSWAASRSRSSGRAASMGRLGAAKISSSL